MEKQNNIIDLSAKDIPDYVDYSSIKRNDSNRFLRKLKYDDILTLAKILGFQCEKTPMAKDDNVIIINYVNKFVANRGSIHIIQRKTAPLNTNQISKIVLCDFDIDCFLFGNQKKENLIPKAEQVYEKYNDYMISMFGKKYLNQLVKYLENKSQECEKNYSQSKIQPQRMKIYNNLAKKYSKLHSNKKDYEKEFLFV